MPKKEEEYLEVEVCCYNCRHKDICMIVQSMWDEKFKPRLKAVMKPEDRQKFFEAVERILARLCTHFDPNV